jgi:hypothetical protein
MPTFEQAKVSLGIESPGPLFGIKGQQIQKAERALGGLAGLRVIAAVRTQEGRGIYIPGVVIAQEQGVRIGCLTSGVDQFTDQKDAVGLLTDHQHLLMGKLFAQHQAGAGGHAHGGAVNSGEVNHASVVVASLNPANIHSRTHQLVDGGAFSAQLAESGATAAITNGRVRENKEVLLGLGQVSAILVASHHQVPWQVGGDVFDLSAGFTYAARMTQERQPDIAANLGSIAS